MCRWTEFRLNVWWNCCFTLPGPGHVRDHDPHFFRVVLRREPSPLQLRITVAAKAEQRGRPGDMRFAPAPLRPILLVHPWRGVSLRTSPHHQIFPWDEGAWRAESRTQVYVYFCNWDTFRSKKWYEHVQSVNILSFTHYPVTTLPHLADRQAHWRTHFLF